ncbi:Putative RNA-binding protein 19 [Anas platyrhynchos]|uniref:Putative RNA-binding protein 19 n=1 Tax=Anas platyrhynchos TaxID=8839 RepID=R0KBK9_ANAPL|nr:Putative RNA-binding protein 19 [Anas platyrhynchos]
MINSTRFPLLSTKPLEKALVLLPKLLPAALDTLRTSVGPSGRGSSSLTLMSALFWGPPDKAFNALCHSTHLYGRRLVLEWADTEESTVEALRRKTADHFHGSLKKRKRSEVLGEILEQLEEEESNKDEAM